MKKLLFVFAANLFFLHAFACNCPTVALTKENLAAYDFIFTGKVVAVSGCSDDASVSFEIEKLYRGKSYREAQLKFDCTSDCGMTFSPGEEWIIYAKYVGYGKAEVKFCSFSRKYVADDKNDFVTPLHGMSYAMENEWLEKTLGVQELNVRNPEDDMHHENIHPSQQQALLYFGLGLAGLLVLLFLTKKFLR
ncbi:MAG TPA: hypothetical protein VFU15_14410 [Bacteroidia bacterium]|nr:hypothetical protein [Bacteroidia bacterium]